jgi:hypothetical protein
LWKFSRDLWKFRNEVVHGATIEDQATRQLEQLKAKITQYYTKFYDNPDFVLGRHKFLFQSRSMEERLQASYDTMASWIRSVEEAIKVVCHHEDNLRELTQVFFPTPHLTDSTAQDSESDSTYTYHSIGSEEDLSLDLTEATTNTMSSAASSASVFTQLIYDSDEESICSEDSLSNELLPHYQVTNHPDDMSTSSSHVSHPLEDEVSLAAFRSSEPTIEGDSRSSSLA